MILKRLIPVFLIVSTSAAASSSDLDKAVKIYYAGLPDQAISLIKPLALSGDVKAQILLGNILYSLSQANNGEIDEPLKWYKMAAAKNSPDANYALGVIYHNKWAELQQEEHLAIAIAYYDKANGLGHQDAQVYLSHLVNRDEYPIKKKLLFNPEMSVENTTQATQIPGDASTEQSVAVNPTDLVKRDPDNNSGTETGTVKLENAPRLPLSNNTATESGDANMKDTAKLLPVINNESDSSTVNLADIANQCNKYTRAGFNYYAESIKGAIFSGTAKIDTIGSSPSRSGTHLIRLTNSKYDTLLFITLDGVPKEIARGLKEEREFEITGIVEDSQIIGSNCDVILTYQLTT